MPHFRKKPVVIEAVQFDGTNADELATFSKGKAYFVRREGALKVDTLEGTMTVSKGDYLICGVHGEFYPCKPDIFEDSYDVV